MIPLRMISFLFSLFNLLVSMLLRAFGKGRKGEKGKGKRGQEGKGGRSAITKSKLMERIHGNVLVKY